MPLVNYSLPNLLQGVSQQPDPLRYDGQNKEQVNMYPSIVEGLTRRPSTEWLFQLLESSSNIGEIPEGSLVHFITTRANEEYVLIHTGSVLYVYNLEDGQLSDILVAGSGTGSYSIPSGHYLECPSGKLPSDVFRVMTVGDTTFLVNTNTVPQSSGAVYDALEKEALVWVKQGDYAKNYTVRLRGDFGGAESVGATATMTVSVESFVEGRNSTTYYRVSSIAIGTGGAGYEEGRIEYTFDSNGRIATQPKFRFNIDASGSITSVDVLDGGKFGAFGVSAPTCTLVMERPTSVTSGAGTGVYISTITSGTFASGEANNDSTLIAAALDAKIYSGGTPIITAGLVTQQVDNLIILTKTAVDAAPNDFVDDFDIYVADGLGGAGLGVAYREVEDITDLPLFAKNGFRIKVKGSDDTGADDYWVRFETLDNSDVGQGQWVECPAPLSNYEIDVDTMPMQLKLTEADTFELSTMPISNRLVGDDVSNPFPSFMGRPITNMFFFKDRLGLISNNNVCMTESGLGPLEEGILHYNWFRATCSQLLDSAPIDVQVTSRKVVDLVHTITMQDKLLLFSDGQQFILKGGDILSPSTVEVMPVTNFSIDPLSPPLEIGESLLFPFNRGDYSGLREMTIDLDTDNYVGDEITKQIPRYIPKDIRLFAGSTVEDVLLVGAEGDSHRLYCNKFHVENRQKILNSWGKMEFPFQIRGMKFIDSDLYMLVNEPREINIALDDVTGTANTSTDPTTYLMDCSTQVAHGLSLGDKVFFDELGVFLVNKGAGPSTMKFVVDPYTKRFEATVSDIPTADTFSFVVQVEDLEYTTDSLNVGSAYTRNWGAQMVKMNMQAGAKDPIGFNTYLDLRFRTAIPVYGTTINLPYWGWGDITDIVIYDVETGAEITPSVIGTSSLTVVGVQFLREVFVGYKFSSSLELSEQLFKSPQGQAATVNQTSKQRIRRGKVWVYETNDFYVDVTPRGRAVLQSFHDADKQDGTRDIITNWSNVFSLNSGSFRFPVQSRGEDTSIKIYTDGVFPLNLQSAEFEVLVESTSERYAR